MRMEKLSEKRVARLVKKFFGKEARWDRKGKYCFVHLDGADELNRRDRVDNFVATLFFDPKCKCCKPFFKDGAFMVYEEGCVMGMRILKDNTFETVLLASDLAIAN